MGRWMFINYRRDDAAAEARLLQESIAHEFGTEAAFLDTEGLQSGTVWPAALRTALGKARVVLAVVGPEWLRAGIDEWGRRRIDDRDDWVRREIAVALKARKEVIPVRVRGAKIPPRDVLPPDIRTLVSRPTVEIRRDFWTHDVQLLLARLRQLRGAVRRAPVDELGPYPTMRTTPPAAIDDRTLDTILAHQLREWRREASRLPENPARE